MCGTRGSNPPKPHYYHLFIQSVHSPDILFFLLLKFCLFIRGVLVAYPIELSSLVEGT